MLNKKHIGEKRSGFFSHTYALTISSLVIGAVFYTLYESAEPDTETVTSYGQPVVMSNEFNYTHAPKPDSFPEEIAVTIPKWLSLTPSPVVEASVDIETIIEEKLEPAVFKPNISRPRIAIIIDDMGMRQNMTRPFSELSAAIDFSFLPYAEGLKWQTRIMNEAGHELMIHLPMEPKEVEQNPGPRALLTSLSDDGLSQTLDWNLERFDGFVGINNHMGSLFTQDAARMTKVVERLKEQNLFFIDSRTSAESTGYSIAKTHGLKYEERDVFLDNVLEHDAIMDQLYELERIAEKNGSAIAIGHPHRETLKALHEWLATVADKGFDIVKVSSLLKQDDLTISVLTSHTGLEHSELTSGGGN